ncbi:alpha/beta fold hydrolase [Paenibacillus senegalimassiliensis]|uniref:alpha/beta fold hydrolase n=1 Tax=Paenibacillus senegalimassiliensis TaxID=1737426 RepID=UPI00073F0ABC|nr:alpha/beta fold hydrolase [Paenibacillus senegalimassiliensis]
MNQSRKPKTKWIKFILWACLLLAVVIGGMFIYLDAKTYEPSDAAKLAMESDAQVQVTQVKDGYKFEPVRADVLEPNVIFYPGGLVEPESYAPFARQLAGVGHRVYLAKMPLNLAIFGQNRAEAFLAEHQGESYIIGGHSLGGVFAARYAAEHGDKLAGVFFLASYADTAGSLEDLNLSALQITASQDGVLNQEAWAESKVNLPEDTLYISIEGGNHGQFGSYGRQKGDQVPTLNEEEQLEQVILAMEDWMQGLHP